MEVKAGILVKQDWNASWKESHKNKLSYNSEENPRLGHYQRYVKCLSVVLRRWESIAGNLVLKTELKT